MRSVSLHPTNNTDEAVETSDIIVKKAKHIKVFSTNNERAIGIIDAMK